MVVMNRFRIVLDSTSARALLLDQFSVLLWSPVMKFLRVVIYILDNLVSTENQMTYSKPVGVLVDLKHRLIA